MAAHKDNKYALGNNGGRPPTFDTPEALQDKCVEYFEYCMDETEKVTITGLALFLGFCSRSSLDDYVKKQEFSYIVKRAKLVVENSYENSGTTIDIFALKQMNWKDQKDLDLTTGGKEIKNDMTFNYGDFNDEV